jgi:RNase P/RNase MRP subunit POP5
MSPKSRPVRWRYIAFRLEGERQFPRNDFLGALLKAARNTNLQDSFRITVYEGDFGILKVPHRFKDDAIEALTSVADVRGVPAKVTTLRTSGTIKTLKEKYAAFIKAGEGRRE